MLESRRTLQQIERISIAASVPALDFEATPGPDNES